MDQLHQRLTTVRHKLQEWEVDGVLIHNGSNRRWLSGFSGSNAQLLVTADQALLATDFRYYDQARAQAPHFTLFKHKRTPQATQEFLKAAAVSRIGLEASHVTLAQAAELREVADHVVWIELAQTVEPLRAIKLAAELEAIRAAAAITDAAMAQVPALARPGITERQLAWQLEQMMREAGADAVAFPIIVASGPNSAYPHYQTGERPLQTGDVIVVDMGAMRDGYRSDLTRTFFLGDAPSDKFKQIYGLVLAAQTAVFDRTRPGMKLKAVDAIARNHISAAGHEEHFGHGLGHGVGLDIHEDPFLSPRTKDEETLLAGMAVTIEPGIYIPGWGGVRIEDLTAVTENGLQTLSHCPK